MIPFPTSVRSRCVPALSRVERAGRELISNDRRFISRSHDRSPPKRYNVPTLLSLLVLFARLTFCMIDSITMTLQLLVEGGHEGGRVVVRHSFKENYLIPTKISRSPSNIRTIPMFTWTFTDSKNGKR